MRAHACTGTHTQGRGNKEGEGKEERGKDTDYKLPYIRYIISSLRDITYLLYVHVLAPVDKGWGPT
jgi:hypothetical protein